jgi:hypothetical protein
MPRRSVYACAQICRLLCAQPLAALCLCGRRKAEARHNTSGKHERAARSKSARSASRENVLYRVEYEIRAHSEDARARFRPRPVRGAIEARGAAAQCSGSHRHVAACAVLSHVSRNDSAQRNGAVRARRMPRACQRTTRAGATHRRGVSCVVQEAIRADNAIRTVMLSRLRQMSS